MIGLVEYFLLHLHKEKFLKFKESVFPDDFDFR